MNSRTFNRGFTLIELLISLAVLGIVVALGLPDLRNLLVSNRLTSSVNSFIGLINYARSEAITRSQSVVICPKLPTAIGCANSQFWAEYEIQAFVDINGNNERNATDILLKTIPVIDATGGSMRLTRPGVNGVISFGASGYSNTVHTFNIHAVNTSDTSYEIKYGRSVCISRPGRPRIIAYGTVCTNF